MWPLESFEVNLRSRKTQSLIQRGCLVTERRSNAREQCKLMGGVSVFHYNNFVWLRKCRKIKEINLNKIFTVLIQLTPLVLPLLFSVLLQPEDKPLSQIKLTSRNPGLFAISTRHHIPPSKPQSTTTASNPRRPKFKNPGTTT